MQRPGTPLWRSLITSRLPSSGRGASSMPSSSPCWSALLLGLLLLCTACTAVGPAQHEREPVQRVAWGSCNKQNRPQPHWRFLTLWRPQLFLWLGDIVYNDVAVLPPVVW